MVGIVATPDPFDAALAAARALVGAAAAPMAIFDAAGACLAANAAYAALHGSAQPVGTYFSPDGVRRWTLATLPAEDPRPPEPRLPGFLSNVGHELRTPLNAVIGFAEIMQEEALGPLGAPEYREYAGLILRSGHALLDLVTNLVDHARAESGSLALQIADVEVVRLLRSVAVAAREDAAAATTLQLPSVEVEAPAGFLAIRADEQRLRQILRALVGNAIKFTPAGGRVRLLGKPMPDGGAEIVVADTGIGMSPTDLAQAFDPFWQADGRAGRSRAGAGIGLKLARHLALLHGGALLLESVPGQGTRATLRLPAAPPPVSGAAAALW